MRKSTTLAGVVVLLILALIALLADRQSAAQGPPGLRPVPKWEYKTIRHDLTTEVGGEVKSELNALGEDGWELCESVQTEGGRPFLILKRPITIRSRGSR